MCALGPLMEPVLLRNAVINAIWNLAWVQRLLTRVDEVSAPTRRLNNQAVCKIGSISLLALLCVFVSVSLQFVKHLQSLFAGLYISFTLAWRGTVNLSLSGWFKMLQVKLPPLCLLPGSLRGLEVWAQRGKGKNQMGTSPGYTAWLGIAALFLC